MRTECSANALSWRQLPRSEEDVLLLRYYANYTSVWLRQVEPEPLKILADGQAWVEMIIGAFTNQNGTPLSFHLLNMAVFSNTALTAMTTTPKERTN